MAPKGVAGKQYCSKNPGQLKQLGLFEVGERGVKRVMIAPAKTMDTRMSVPFEKAKLAHFVLRLRGWMVQFMHLQVALPTEEPTFRLVRNRARNLKMKQLYFC